MMTVTRKVSGREITKDGFLASLNREIVPVLEETRSALNRLEKVTFASAAYLILPEDYLIIVSSATGVDITMPDATRYKGRSWIIKNVGVGVATPACVLSQLIDGAAGPAWPLPQYYSLTVVSDGTGFVVTGLFV